MNDDKLHEECGIFGIYAPGVDVALNTYWGLYALQHRGQESAGICVANGYAMDTFVVDQRQFMDHQREMTTLIEAGLAEALLQKGPLPEPARARLSRQSRSFPIPPAVDLRPDTRGQYHVLNVTAADRTGLLYAIARTLAAHQIRLQTARVMTLGERAEDVFLIEGDALNDNKQQIALETDLLKAIAA